MSFFLIAIMVLLHIILPAKSLVEMDESMIEVNDSSTFSIDIEYVLGSDIDVESKLQVKEGNNNSEIENNDLKDCHLEDN